jgi:hypothetical protein
MTHTMSVVPDLSWFTHNPAHGNRWVRIVFDLELLRGFCALTPYTFRGQPRRVEDDGACQVVEIERRPVAARKYPSLA